MDIWTPVIGQALLVKREPTNPKDKNAVAVYEDSIVGHVSFTLPISIFGKEMSTRPLLRLQVFLRLDNDFLEGIAYLLQYT